MNSFYSLYSTLIYTPLGGFLINQVVFDVVLMLITWCVLAFDLSVCLQSPLWCFPYAVDDLALASYLNQMRVQLHVFLDACILCALDSSDSFDSIRFDFFVIISYHTCHRSLITHHMIHRGFQTSDPSTTEWLLYYTECNWTMSHRWTKWTATVFKLSALHAWRRYDDVHDWEIVARVIHVMASWTIYQNRVDKMTTINMIMLNAAVDATTGTAALMPVHVHNIGETGALPPMLHAPHWSIVLVHV